MCKIYQITFQQKQITQKFLINFIYEIKCYLYCEPMETKDK